MRRVLPEPEASLHEGSGRLDMEPRQGGDLPAISPTQRIVVTLDGGAGLSGVLVPD